MTIDEVASAVIEKLRGKVIIHRYDAYSTNSVYLKFDYGVANSLGFVGKSMKVVKELCTGYR